MANTITKEFKALLLDLPQKEKDRLLLRFIRKDKLLFEQLEFQLLEDETDINFRRQNLKEDIDDTLDLGNHLSYYQTYKLTKKLNSKISWHTRVTKDAYGEIELTLYLLKKILNDYPQYSNAPAYKFRYSIADYICKRTNFTIKKARKLHSDIQFDFKSDFDFLLETFYTPNTITFGLAQTLALPHEF